MSDFPNRKIYSTVAVLAKGYLPDPGGIERYSYDFCEAYETMFDRVYVLTQTSIGPRISHEGKRIVIDVGTASQLSLLLKFALVWRRIKQHARPTFVHATTWRVALPAVLISSRFPLAVTVHGREVLIVPRFLRPVMRFVLAKAVVVAVVSNAIRTAYAQGQLAGTDNWVTVWNGLSFRRQASVPHERPRRDMLKVFAFSRLVERKNIRGAIEAVAVLKERGVRGFTLDIAGTGPEKDSLQELIVRRDLVGCVRLLGYISDDQVVPCYRDADIFLHPQIASSGGGDIEGFGLTIADAMSFGLAVVAGRDGGPSDFIQDGCTGLVVDGNDVECIADALQSLIQSPTLREEMGERARNWALTELDWIRSAERVMQACKGRPPADPGFKHKT